MSSTLPHYYVLFSPKDDELYRHLVIPTAVFQKTDKGRYQVEIVGSQRKILPDEVAFTRLRMDDYDPRNPAFEHLLNAPTMGSQPRMLRTHLNKVKIRDLVRAHHPDFPQPDYWGIGITGKSGKARMEGPGDGVFHEIERRVRAGEVMYLKPWDGYSGRGVVRIKYNPRLRKVQFFTPDQALKGPMVEQLAQRGSRDISARRSLSVRQFIKDIFVPLVKSPKYPVSVGGLILETEIPALTEHKEEIRFFCMGDRVVGHYAKVGQGNLVASRAQGGAGVRSEETVERILRQKYRELKKRNPGFKPSAMGPQIRRFLEEARKAVEKVARTYHKTALKLNRTQTPQYPVERLALDEVAVDVVPHFDESAGKLKPMLVEINNGRIAIKGLKDSNPDAYQRVMRLRRDGIEKLFLSEVSRREPSNGVFQSAQEARRYLDAAHQWIRMTAIAPGTNGQLPRLRPKQGQSIAVRQTAARLGVRLATIKSPVPHSELSSFQFEMRPSGPVQTRKIRRAFELLGH